MGGPGVDEGHLALFQVYQMAADCLDAAARKHVIEFHIIMDMPGNRGKSFVLDHKQGMFGDVRGQFECIYFLVILAQIIVNSRVIAAFVTEMPGLRFALFYQYIFKFFVFHIIT